MLLDLPLPMCRAGNKAGDGWMKGIPIDTSNCGGTLNRLLNRLFRTWENELELPVWPMWLRAIMAPYVGGKCPGTICSTSSKTHRSGFHFKRRDLGDVCVFFFSANKNDCLRVEGQTDQHFSPKIWGTNVWNLEPPGSHVSPAWALAARAFQQLC